MIVVSRAHRPDAGGYEIVVAYRGSDVVDERSPGDNLANS